MVTPELCICGGSDSRDSRGVGCVVLLPVLNAAELSAYLSLASHTAGG